MYQRQLCVAETLLFIQVIGIAILAAQVTAGYATNVYLSTIDSISKFNETHTETVIPNSVLDEICLSMGYRAVFTPSSTCSVSQQEVDEVVNIINDANIGLIIEPRSAADSKNYISVSSMDPCQLALMKIKEGAKKLKECVGKLKSSDELSEAEIRKLVKSYRGDIQELGRQLENIKRQAGHGEQLTIIQLESEMQIFQQNCDASVNELERTRRELRENKIRLCISKIGSNEIKSAVKIFKELNDNDVLNRIINAAYQNFENVLKFTHDLYDWQQWSIGYPALLDEMKSNNDLNTPKVFILAYSVSEVMAGKYGINSALPQKFRNTFEVLKQGFPDAVQSILWDTVCIKNNQYREYLYAPLHGTYDNDRRNVFTWTEKEEMRNDAIWSLEAIDEGRSFRIRNVRRNELFYAADCCAHDSERRRVFTWRQKDDGSHAIYKWILEPINAAQSFQIKSVYHNEYMYALDHGTSFKGENRQVFTWRHKGVSAGSQGVWDIEPCHPIQHRC